MSASSTRAIFFALGANTGIAINKFPAYTGSDAMRAEAIRRVADCANQLLLLPGLKRAKKPATAERPPRLPLNIAQSGDAATPHVHLRRRARRFRHPDPRPESGGSRRCGRPGLHGFGPE